MARKRPSEGKKLPGGAMLYKNGVKHWGSQDPNTFEYVTHYECTNCGEKKELREEIPNAAKRAAFRQEAKTHNCDNAMKSRQFIEAAVAQEKTRRDIHG